MNRGKKKSRGYFHLLGLIRMIVHGTYRAMLNIYTHNVIAAKSI
jgi:hypothetical protein